MKQHKSKWIKKALKDTKCSNAHCGAPIASGTICVDHGHGSYGCKACGIKYPTIWAGPYPFDQVESTSMSKVTVEKYGLLNPLNTDEMYEIVPYIPHPADDSDLGKLLFPDVSWHCTNQCSNSLDPNKLAVIFFGQHKPDSWMTSGSAWCNDCAIKNGVDVGDPTNSPSTADSPKRILNIVSFGYKYGKYPETLGERLKIFDVRQTIRNPWKNPELRKLTGLDERVQKYVGVCPVTQKLMSKASAAPLFNTGTLTIAFGCYGGKHRSVALAEMIAAKFKDLSAAKKYAEINIIHRDLNR